MKKIVFFSLSLVLLSACGGNTDVSVGDKTTMEINQVFDAGDVVKGEMVSAEFELKNTGEYPLVIGEVKGSCSCTVADYPHEPIAPGETGTVLAHVDTDKVEAGLMNKGVRIVCNTDPSITEVVIRANVMRK
ncbi:MAG: DUF1573 domain-containing protein [Crocinitomicaceae bacterium]|jgi:hypothetical protein|nr:DUF1573 domain-containing protein [Crocinitomicaceae bacterium]